MVRAVEIRSCHFPGARDVFHELMWREGPRAAMRALIEQYTSIVLPPDAVAIASLRRLP
jgi:hypothetical protein